jgi:Flp pilus assembly CpaE family ATPase
MAEDTTAVESRPGPEELKNRAPADLARRFAVLEGAPVFFELPDRTLRLLARRFRQADIPSGGIVLDIGELNECIYFVAEGLCESTVAAGAPSSWVQKLPAGEMFGLASAMLETRQPTAVMAVEPSVVYYLTRQAVRSALQEVPGAVEELERLAAQVLESHRQSQLRATSTLLPRTDAVVIPVYSASGGSGRTTIALNLAAALAAEAPGTVLLVDLSLPYTQACLMANLIPTGSLATTDRFGSSGVEQALLSSALYHPNGMMVLPAATRAEEAELVTPRVVAETLAALKGKFSFIVVDMAVPLTEVAVTVFDKAQQVVLVLTPDLSAIRGAGEAVKILEDAFGIPPQLVTIVLNNRSAKPATSLAAVAAALGRSPDVEIRYDDSRPDRASLHGTLSIDDARSSFRPAMLELVARVNSLCVAPDTRAAAPGAVRDSEPA